MLKARRAAAIRLPGLAAATVLVVLLAGCAAPERDPTYPERVLGSSTDTILVETYHAPGYAPSDAARTHLISTLRNVTGKNVEWNATQTARLADPGRPWNITRDLAPLARELVGNAPAGSIFVVVLHPAGRDQNPDAAGISLAPGGPSVVYLDALREAPSPTSLIPLPRDSIVPLERATLLHEVGHTIGLVNAGLPMQRPHEDADHAGHSSNARSVMYWALDSTDAIREILLRDESLPSTFDSNDLADLGAARDGPA